MKTRIVLVLALLICASAINCLVVRVHLTMARDAPVSTGELYVHYLGESCEVPLIIDLPEVGDTEHWDVVISDFGTSQTVVAKLVIGEKTFCDTMPAAFPYFVFVH